MKRRKRPKTPVTRSEVMIWLQTPEERRDRRETAREPVVTVTRIEKRSWVAVAITGFGALLVRYLRIVKERGRRFL